MCYLILPSWLALLYRLTEELLFPDQSFLETRPKAGAEKLSGWHICALKFSLGEYTSKYEAFLLQPGTILLPYDGSPSARLADEVSGGPGRLQLVKRFKPDTAARHRRGAIWPVTCRTSICGSCVWIGATEWQKIRQRYLEEEIKPLLAQGQELLRRQGFRAPIELKIVEGKIGEQILEVAQSGNYSTIIMGRRGLSPVKELWLGSSTHYVLTRAAGLTVFVVGPEPSRSVGKTHFPSAGAGGRFGSLFGSGAAGGGPGAGRAEQQPQITLMHVLDLALLGLTLAEEAEMLLEEGQKALAEARQILDQAGLGIHPGKAGHRPSGPGHCPGSGSASHALVYMGSVGHSALARFLIGSITSSVLHLVSRPTLAVAYPRAISLVRPSCSPGTTAIIPEGRARPSLNCRKFNDIMRLSINWLKDFVDLTISPEAWRIN